jgi:two-component system, NarL family, nitrate/nitrite response regulator NarL
MKEPIRVAIVDDHPLIRDGLTHVLGDCPDFIVVGEGSSAEEAVEIAKSRKPDILVLDVGLPGGGLSALEAIAAGCPDTKVLMLTISVDRPDVLKAMRLGARGYVIKGASGPEIVQALRSIHHGDRHVSPSVGAMLLSDINHRKSSTMMQAIETLNHREDEILTLVMQGLSNKEIGTKLSLSDKTVKQYMTSVFQKLKVRNRVEAAMLASRSKQSQSRRDGQYYEGSS